MEATLGADKVARWLHGVVPADTDLCFEWAVVNGSPAVLLRIDGQLELVGSVLVIDGQVAEIYLVRNPDKLPTSIDPRPVSLG